MYSVSHFFVICSDLHVYLWIRSPHLRSGLVFLDRTDDRVHRYQNHGWLFIQTVSTGSSWLKKPLPFYSWGILIQDIRFLHPKYPNLGTGWNISIIWGYPPPTNSEIIICSLLLILPDHSGTRSFNTMKQQCLRSHSLMWLVICLMLHVGSHNGILSHQSSCLMPYKHVRVLRPVALMVGERVKWSFFPL